jgi:hypothetical protein
MPDVFERIADLDDAPVECDGFARIAATWLAEAGVAHFPQHGQAVLLFTPEISIYPHFWISLEGDRILDYRLRMWAAKCGLSSTDARVPHGVFDPADYPWLSYRGGAVELAPVAEPLIAAMTWRPDWELMKELVEEP